MQGLWEREGGVGASLGIRDRQREPRGRAGVGDQKMEEE